MAFMQTVGGGTSIDPWTENRVEAVVVNSQEIADTQMLVRQDLQYLQVMGLVLIVGVFAVLAWHAIGMYLPTSRDLTGD